MNINQDVTTALLADNELKHFDITAVSTKGDLRLTGEVDNQSQINQALLLAEAVTGVKTIHNELTVKR
ncbi:BON domain-containing protein [Rheinheimera sediminis]|nr:BON domain-containing protein [Rheinheimera sp. YQF-1]